ncbi:hypothetical protein [Amycolatopsis minnesotensis]|uniref:Uncharacterized protein n=1 Tax=Amycolatopsis minnesotensis TaxID=337894 RepID=A0ABP5CZV9_9PSEU
MNRMNREEFFAKLTGLDEERLKKALWNLYWRGNATVRERIETELEPDTPKRTAKPTVTPDAVLAEVREFVPLAKSGAYLGGDRRVSPKERTRWRFTFQRLVSGAQTALAAEDPDPGIAAMELLIDLACETRDYDHFRSEEPLEAARFVVSDALERLWDRLRQAHGFDRFAESAAAHLVRWESQYGWTRGGWSSIAQKETSLASILARKLEAPDMWITVTDHYLDALDQSTGTQDFERDRRTRNLAEWHELLLDRLPDYDADDRLDRIAEHHALGGPELKFFRAQLAQQRGDLGRARELVSECLAKLPGHREFQAFALEIDAPLPKHARQMIESDRRANALIAATTTRSGQ